MTNPFWYKGERKTNPDLIDTEYIYWYYRRSWRAPYFWFKYNRLARLITKCICLSLLFGFCTFWIVVALTILGSPVNPYLFWLALWQAANLAMVYVVAKREAESSG